MLRVLEAVPEASLAMAPRVCGNEDTRGARTRRRANHAREGFDYLSFITEVDWQDRYELIYHLYSYDYHAQPLGAILRGDLPREGCPNRSVTSSGQAPSSWSAKRSK